MSNVKEIPIPEWLQKHLDAYYKAGVTKGFWYGWLCCTTFVLAGNLILGFFFT